MKRSVPGVAARVVAIVGIVGALVMQGASAQATDYLSLLNCPTPTPTPTPSEQPTATPDSSPSPTPTPDNCVPKSGSVISGPLTMRFSVSTNSTQTHIDSVQAFITSKTQGVPDPNQSQIIVQCPTSCKSSSLSRRSETDAVPWNTNVLTPHNGAYTFHVKAHYLGNYPYPYDATKTADDQCVLGCNLVVDNPPQQPNAPRIVVATEKSVSVAWDANPEPDVLSYTLYRAVTKDKKTMPTDSQFKVDFTTVGTSARDPVTTAGAYWYRVQATRRSLVTPDTGISSPVSESSGPALAGPVATPTPKPGSKGKGAGTVVALPPPPAAILTPPGLIPSVAAAPPPVPDAPYSAYLPYKSSGTSEDAGPPAPEAGGSAADPRGAVLPVAVGAFLVCSALALGRMPF